VTATGWPLLWARGEQIGRLPSPSFHRFRLQRDRGSRRRPMSYSHLTVNGLLSDTVYYLRWAHQLEWSVEFCGAERSTRTLAGLAPTNPQITGVYITTMSVTWGSSRPTALQPGGLDRQRLYRRTHQQRDLHRFAHRLDVQLGSLGGQHHLLPSGGQLWNGTTAYANTRRFRLQRGPVC